MGTYANSLFPGVCPHDCLRIIECYEDVPGGGVAEGDGGAGAPRLLVWILASSVGRPGGEVKM